MWRTLKWIEPLERTLMVESFSPSETGITSRSSIIVDFWDWRRLRSSSLWLVRFFLPPSDLHREKEKNGKNFERKKKKEKEKEKKKKGKERTCPWLWQQKKKRRGLWTSWEGKGVGKGRCEGEENERKGEGRKLKDELNQMKAEELIELKTKKPWEVHDWHGMVWCGGLASSFLEIDRLKERTNFFLFLHIPFSIFIFLLPSLAPSSGCLAHILWVNPQRNGIWKMLSSCKYSGEQWSFNREQKLNLQMIFEIQSHLDSPAVWEVDSIIWEECSMYNMQLSYLETHRCVHFSLLQIFIGFSFWRKGCSLVSLGWWHHLPLPPRWCPWQPPQLSRLRLLWVEEELLLLCCGGSCRCRPWGTRWLWRHGSPLWPHRSRRSRCGRLKSGRPWRRGVRSATLVSVDLFCDAFLSLIWPFLLLLSLALLFCAVKRRGIVFVQCKKHPRHKQRQGWDREEHK